MPTYLDVQVLRIQTYLGRWEQLAGRRGASRQISLATDAAEIAARIGDAVHANPDAPEIDGKVSLIVADGHDPERTATKVIELVRRSLPAAEIGASWTPAETYLDALAERSASVAAGSTLLSLPAVNDLPLARPCDRCRVSPAHTRERWRGEDQRVCADCAARSAEDSPRGRAERQLRALLEQHGDPGEARDFGELADLGTDAKHNHLATVFVDGNQIGRFFQALSGEASEVKRAVSAGVAAAVRDAVTDAALAAWTAASPDRSTAAPVSLHVLGGDDVLLSVPASVGWQSTVALLRSLEQRTAALLDDQGLASRVEALTASAGLLFAHHHHPFASCVEQAEVLLEDAKGLGRHHPTSAVAWADLTQHGTAPVPGRPPWSLADLEAAAPDLDELRALPASARRTLEELVRPDRGEQIALAGVRRFARRQRHDGLERFDVADGPARLRDLLDIVRWWS